MGGVAVVMLVGIIVVEVRTIVSMPVVMGIGEVIMGVTVLLAPVAAWAGIEIPKGPTEAGE
jgi:hypothetical protein